MKLQNKTEYYIANDRDTLVRDFGNNLDGARKFMDECVPPEKCNSYRIVAKVVTYMEVPRETA